MTALTLKLPSLPKTIAVGAKEILMLTSGDMRETANIECWPKQKEFEGKLEKVLKDRFGLTMKRAFSAQGKHGFIRNQREGSDIFASIDPDQPIIVLLTAWQFSHLLVNNLVQHRGPILLLANFDGTWPGLVGTLGMAGCLTSLGRPYARLWSENFDDDFFYSGLGEWLKTGRIVHDLSYLKEVSPFHPALKTKAAALGREVGQYILRNKEIMGLFDTMCMGMINGTFPLPALADIGMPMEGLSQSALFFEMEKIPQSLREECLRWYEERGMQFKFGTDPATELTREQVMEQCAMMIVLARFADKLGLSAVGVQYQLGLKDTCATSDFAEGAIGSAERFPIPDENGKVIRPGKPIPCINEVDMGAGIPQVMMFRLLDSLGLPSETTLHDIRWGSEYQGTFYWDLEISGAVPFAHIKGGIAGAEGHRQPAMYFPKGGATIGGQCKAGTFLWARAHYEGTKVYLHVGTGVAVELPQDEFKRRHNATTSEWPLMNCTLDGMGRNDLMAGHESNHIIVAYVPEDKLAEVTAAFVAQAMTQNMKVFLAGTPKIATA